MCPNHVEALGGGPASAPRPRAQHGRRYAKTLIDLLSSAASFTGWRREPRCREEDRRRALETTAAPRTCLLRVGWQKWGLIDPGTIPGRLAT